MGQGESSHSDAERLFEVLDKDKSGDLSMNELLSIQELPGLNLPFTNSPLLLFKYNEAEDGKISREDFAKLVHFFREESKKLQKRFEQVTSVGAGPEQEKEKEKLLGLFPRRNTLKRSQSRNDITSGVRTCIDVNKDTDLHVSRDGSTPMLTGRVRPEEAREEQAREKEALEEMLHEPPVDTRKLVKKILSDEEGQQKFLAWLFRFADVDHKEVISVSQLSKLLKVLAKDGINVATLSYDQTPTSPQASEHLEDDPAYAQHLLEEYDIGHTGYLTRDEFLKLGDLILRQYATETSSEHDMLKSYVLGRKLGVGASGVVRLAVHRDSHARKAVKIIHRGDVTDMSRLDTEIKAMLLLRHPRVVQLDEVLEDAERIYFVMELCGGGSLADFVAEKPLDERLARFYFAELVEGVAYCHAQGVCHRDLKLENLLCDNLGHLKITDFGHAGIFQKGWDIFQTGLVGTLWHLAPEQIAGQAYSGERVDVWAMGVALYRMLSGDPPFLSSNPVEFLEAVKSVKWTRPAAFSAEVIALLERIFVATPDQRITLDDMREHPWLKGEKRAPEFLRKQLWIGKWADIEVPWHLMLEIVHDLHIFTCTVAPEGENVTALRKMIKCQVPEKDLKFSISFKNKRTENPFFHFKLREGEAEVFHDLCAQISTKFEEKMADQRLHEAKEQRSSTLTGLPELPLHDLIIDDYAPPKGGETTPRARLPSRPTSPSVPHANSVLDHRDK